MQRRQLLIAGGGALWFAPARAHHGWSGFDQSRPIYLEGVVRKVEWRNPHVELELELRPGLALPADLARRELPAQTAPVDGAKLLAGATLPTRKDRVWQIELAPLPRMEAWKVEPIKDRHRLSRWSGSPAPARRAIRCCAPSTCSAAVYGLRHAVVAGLTLRPPTGSAGRRSTTPLSSGTAGRRQRAAATVAAMSSAPCAALTKPASYRAPVRGTRRRTACRGRSG